MPTPTMILNEAAIKRVLTRIAHEIAERNEAVQDVVMIGIHRGGIHLATRLSQLLSAVTGHLVPVGSLDVSMHRDDLEHRITPAVFPTVIPFDVTGKIVVLVDDVLFSGRTIRAALDALNDFGRPKCVQLAVLIDRASRTANQSGFHRQERSHFVERADKRESKEDGRRTRSIWKSCEWHRKTSRYRVPPAEEIITVLDTARAFRSVGTAIKKFLRSGENGVNLFVEPSTRTRISFSWRRSGSVPT